MVKALVRAIEQVRMSKIVLTFNKVPERNEVKGVKGKAKKKDNKKKVKVGDVPVTLDGKSSLSQVWEMILTSLIGRKYRAATINNDSSSEDGNGDDDDNDDNDKKNEKVTARNRHRDIGATSTSQKQAPPHPSWIKPYVPSSRDLEKRMPASSAPSTNVRPTSQVQGPSKAKYDKDLYQSDNENLMDDDGERRDNRDENSEEEDQVDGYISDQDDMPGVDDLLNEVSTLSILSSFHYLHVLSGGCCCVRYVIIIVLDILHTQTIHPSRQEREQENRVHQQQDRHVHHRYPVSQSEIKPGPKENL